MTIANAPRSFANTHHWLDTVEAQLDEQVKLTGGNDRAVIYVAIADLRVILKLARQALPAKNVGFLESVTVKPKAIPLAPLTVPQEPRLTSGEGYLNGVVELVNEYAQAPKEPKEPWRK